MENSRDNLELAKLFCKRAEADLKSAKDLLNNEDYADAVYHTQQCCEKIVKSLLILHKRFVRTHFVSNLLKEILDELEDKEKIEELIPIIKSLEIHWALPRYPEPAGEENWDPLKEYTKKDAEEAFKKAEFVFKTLTKFLKEKYGI